MLQGLFNGGPSIGTGLNIIKDPDTGRRNMAYHRHRVTDKEKMGCQMRAETDPWKTYQKYEKRNEAMPIDLVN